MRERGLRVVIASGGTPAPWLVGGGVELVQLPPVRASDLAFTSLLDEHDRPIDDTFRTMRRDRLLALFQELRPRVIITEMFPFGRRAFRFELVPLLEAAARACPRPWRLCSVRDVLVRKPDPEGYAWMLAQAHAHFDRILAHTDPQLIPFGAHLSPRRSARRPSGRDRLRDRAAHGGDRRRRRRSPGLRRRRPGRRALLEAALEARPLSCLRERPWRLIAGGNLPGDAFQTLDARLPRGMILERQRDDFPALLANSLLSVSQAGYNTVLEGLRFHKPMVLVPFETATETEQRTRAERLVDLGFAEVVWESELTPQALAGAIDRAWRTRPGRRPELRLDGAARSADLVAALAATRRPIRPPLRVAR